MSVIRTYPDPILSTPVPEFNFSDPPIDTNELSLTLMSVMNAHNAVGLAANQLGLPYRVFVMRSFPENYVCFNPKIVYYGDKTSLGEEGCISFPNVNIKIKRAEKIRVRFQTPTGLIATETFEGLTARVFQHELDHLDGILFYNRANRYHRDKALKGLYNGKRN